MSAIPPESRRWNPKVFLVGAGPGDAGLLTRRGEQCLRRADLVLYDHLTNPAILALARPGAEMVYVGKKAREARPEQEAINERLVAEARAGRIVVRLKGGDGFVFGRGGEEALALLEAGIPFEVVPGVTSAIAAPALAGIPATHRGLATTFHAAVGFEDPDEPGCSVDWERLGGAGGTILIMMGSHHLGKILRRLRAGGLPEDTPLAAIHWGGRPRQRSLRCRLGEALADLSRIHLPPPSITVAGAVAGLPPELNWFERRPLFGRRIAVTRPEESGETLEDDLRESGAEVLRTPAVRFKPAGPEAETSMLERLAEARSAGGWIVLPSPAAIRFFFAALDRAGLDARTLAGLRVAAVGKRSAADLEARGIRADFVPDTETGAALAAGLPLAPGDRAALIAGSAQTRDELAEGLAARGLRVLRAPLYDTVPDPEGIARLAEALNSGEADSVLVLSPSAAKAIHEGFQGPASGWLTRPIWLPGGPTTAAAIKDFGMAEGSW